MKFVNIGGRLAIRLPEGDVDVAQASDGRFGPDPSAALEQWAEFSAWAAEVDAAAAQAAGGSVRPTAEADQLGSPVTRPRQLFAIGLNYRAHAAESGFPVPEHPPTFTKFVSSITGPTGEIALPEGNVDWEVELVAVIGKEARKVKAAEAWQYVAALTAGQDLSERVGQMNTTPPQFSLGKSHPGFAPMGPVLVTVDEFADPDDLEVSCAINGEIVQKGRTNDLVFTIPDLIERLSETVTLLPGDVIFTGTPAGVGMGRSPQWFLKEGDELITTIEGIGEMKHRFVAAD